LLQNAFDSVGPKLDCKLNSSTSATNEPSKETSKEQENIDPNVQQTANVLNAAQLKKKGYNPKILRGQELLWRSCARESASQLNLPHQRQKEQRYVAI
jgi:hypothetical protein